MINRLENHSQSLLNFLTQDLSEIMRSEPKVSTPLAKKQQARWKQRFHPPYGPSGFRGRLEADGQQDFPIDIWNLSESGACLKASVDLTALKTRSFILQVFNEPLPDTVVISAVVRWVDRVSPNVFFAGIRFAPDHDPIKDSFLGSYLG